MKAKDAFPPEDEFETEAETAEEAAAEAAALPHPPAGLSEDEQADWWMKNLYQGERMPQMTVRAIVGGMIIGGLMSISNLYVGLKTGWGLGVTVTAAVIAYAVFKSLATILPGLRRNPLTMLENCTVLTTASAAGAITSAGLVSAIPALYLCTGQPLGTWQMMAWLLCLASLGLCMAVPLKRQLIDIDQLPFPSGTATAETLKGLHGSGAKAMQQAKTLLYCGLFGAALKFWVEGWDPLVSWMADKLKFSHAAAARLAGIALPDDFPLFPGEIGRRLHAYGTIGFEGSTIMLAAGALMGIRVGASMLLGAVVFFGVLAPLLDAHGIIAIEPGGKAFRGITTWTLWPAVALMVTAGLTNLALRWRVIARALGELGSIFGGRSKQKSAAAHVEVPTSWFLIGVGATGTACVVLGWLLFRITPWMGALAVLLTFVLSIVAARATGETDVTPIGAMGKITQLTYGVIAPGNMTTNLMTASITAGAASHSADLLSSLKTGYLVGANPRRQAIGQLFGILMGVLVAVPIYTIIVRTPPFDPQRQEAAAKTPAATARINVEDDLTKTNLMSNQFPTPAVVVWYKVAQLLSEGVKKLPKYSVWGMLIGGILGVVIAILEEFLPRKAVKWLPSATGLGLSGVIPAHNSIAMFLGAFAAWIWTKAHSRSAEDYVVSGSSGLIAGESLTGVGINLVAAAPTIGPAIWRSLFGH